MTDMSDLFRALTRAVVFALGLTLVSLGCSPNAKNEQQYWDNHQKEMAEFKAKWPGFNALLAAREAKAKPIFEEASKATDEKVKADKMKEANEALAGGLLGKMTEVKYKAEGIEGQIKSMNDLKLDKAKQEDRAEAIAAARAELDAVDAAMKAAKPATEEEAVKLVEEQIGKLISASGDADRALTALKGGTKPAAKKKK
jgi:hypothetical protein